jgi:hypothetical protein
MTTFSGEGVAEPRQRLPRNLWTDVPVDVSGDCNACVTEDSDTTLSGTPADNITEAAECRSVCSPTEEGSPARLAAAFKARSALRGSQGSPSSVVNTYGVGCHIEPALSRSAR